MEAHLKGIGAPPVRPNCGSVVLGAENELTRKDVMG